MARSRRATGFSLIEAMVVIAVIGVLAAMAIWGLSYGSSRARMNNAAYEVASLISVAKLRAAASGHPNYVIFFEGTDGAFGVTQMERQEPGSVTLPTWDDSSTGVDATDKATWLGAATGQFLDTLNFKETGGVVFQPLADYSDLSGDGGTALPRPYSGVSLAGTGTTGMLTACNFCLSVQNGRMGVLRFGADGLVSSPTAPTATGLAIGLGPQAGSDSSASSAKRLVVVATPAGAMRVF